MTKRDKARSGYDGRRKHKLNMLEPGSKMLKWIGALALAGCLLLLARLDTAAYCVFGLSGALAVILAVLLMIESHQDRVLNDIAEKENRAGKD